MTTMKSGFDLGQKVFTIDKDEMKMVSFEVAKITCVMSKDKNEAYLYASEDSSWYQGYKEKNCFASEEELLEHLHRDDG